MCACRSSVRPLKFDVAVAQRARAATGGTLRATVEQGLRMVIDASAADANRGRAATERHRRGALDRHRRRRALVG